MKIDRVIVSVDDNRNYQQYWPYFAEACYSKLNIKPTLLWVASNPQKAFPYPSDIGEIIVVPQLPRVNVMFQSKIVRWIAAATMEGVSLVNDIDMIFISPRILAPYQTLDSSAEVVVWSNTDPSFLRENRLLEDTTRFIPMIFSGFLAGDGTWLRKVFKSNGIPLSSGSLLQNWTKDLADRLLNIPSNYVGYPSAFIWSGSNPSYFSDQRYMNQLYHHYYMSDSSAKDPYWYPLTGMHANCTFGEAKIWWPSEAEIAQAREMLRKSSTLNIDISQYAAVHWYREPLQDPTLSLLANYVKGVYNNDNS